VDIDVNASFGDPNEQSKTDQKLNERGVILIPGDAQS
jgi:hypothetical protein